MRPNPRQSVRLLALTALLSSGVFLAACGGGGGSAQEPPVANTPAPAPAPAPATSTPNTTPTTSTGTTTSSTSATTTPTEAMTTIEGVVADGYIQGATACLDENRNGICDAGEPSSGTTNATGGFRLSIPLIKLGKFPIVASVPAGAVDSDLGPVTQSFTLVTPPSTNTSTFISPLTTLVHEVLTASGGTDTAAAIEQVRQELGMTGSPMNNFLADRSTNTDSARAGTMAQVITAVRQQVSMIAASNGVSATNTRALVAQVTLQNMSNLADSVANQGTKTSAQAASALVASNGITPQTVATQAQVAVSLANATTDTATATPVPYVTLRDFRYTDANNWNYRVFTGDDIPRADGYKRSNDVRVRKQAGVFVPFARNQNFYDAASGKWFDCDSAGFEVGRFISPTNTTAGQSSYCNTYTFSSRRSNEDIAGQTVGSVVQRIRDSGLSDYSSWGPAVAQLSNASATFPAGSVLRYQQDTNLSTPLGMNLLDKVRVYKNTAAPRFEDWPFASTLEEMVQYYPGTFLGGTANGSNTDALGQIPDASVTNSTLQQLKNYRIAFQSTSSTGGNIQLWVCRRNAAAPTGNGFTNCTTPDSAQLFTSTYTITTLADSRVMTFGRLPDDILGYRKFERIYVERGGAVFYGFKDVLQTSTTIRMNQTAWDALRAQVPGLVAHTDPSAPVAAEVGSWLRDMRRNQTVNGTSTFVARWFNSQATTPAGGTFTEVYWQKPDEQSALAPFTRNSMYLLGGVWKSSSAPDNQCPDNGLSLGTYSNSPRTSLYCGFSGSGATSFDVDISGKNVSTTLADMRLYGSFDSGRDYSVYGPSNPISTDPQFASFNSAVFPTGSKLRYQMNNPITTTFSFNTASTVNFNNVSLVTLGSLTTSFNGGYGTTATGANTLGLWQYQSNSTVAAGTTGQKRFRVGFDPASAGGTSGAATYYWCDVSSASGNPSTACVTAGVTTYSVQTLGSKNVLTFNSYPAFVDNARGNRNVYVEHNGLVRSGGIDIVGGKTPSQRLNSTAGNFILSLFGVNLDMLNRQTCAAGSAGSCTFP
jgi:trimeric autotransporter adhesin